jgi:hypothetical protein
VISRWGLVALIALGALGCRHGRRRPHAKAGPVVVTKAGVADGAATAIGASLDETYAGACPRRIALTGSEPDVTRAIAQACVRGFATHGEAPLPSAGPWVTGLVEIGVTSFDPAEATSLRMLARAEIAQGHGEDLLRHFDPAAGPDRRAVEAIAFALTEQLVQRPGAGMKAALEVARVQAKGGVEVALERVHTDAETFFAVARASILEWKAPAAPKLVALVLEDSSRLVAEIDRPLHAGAVKITVCERLVDATIADNGDAIPVAFDPSTCAEVDGARLVLVELGGASWSPRGVDGAYMPRTFGLAKPREPTAGIGTDAGPPQSGATGGGGGGD